ncbi:MAG: VOC family protein [Pseudomonadota bacterium]
MSNRKRPFLNRREFSQAGTLSLAGLAFAAGAHAETTESSAEMETVTGIGGFFFVAEEPAALSQWYRDNLGIDLAPQHTGGLPWQQQAGFTVFDPFPVENDMIPPGKTWMINFRVANIDKMVAQLRRNGSTVSDVQDYPHGRFASLTDPEGNGIQLWELAG